MSDLIDRQAAIDALAAMPCKSDEDGYVWIVRFDAWARIDALSPAEPKRGKWIDDGSELGCQCSQCGKTLDEYINCGTEYMTLTEIPKFCPNCGADMR